MSDYLPIYKNQLNLEALTGIRQAAMKNVVAVGMQDVYEAYEAIPEYSFEHSIFTEDVVLLGEKDVLDSSARAELEAKLKALAPWRKGPFEIAGIQLDAEWRSHYKWNRVAPALEPLEGRRVCDIGANSGYYMYRMLAQNPEMVLGLDPTVRYYLQFLALQKLTTPNQLYYEPFGLQEMRHYPKFFDTVFCMGILYHHRSPVDILRLINDSMVKGGQLIVESQGIPGAGPYALFPERTYAKVKGTYFVPTVTCLVNWLKRAWFENIEVFCVVDMSSNEQRRTEWMVRQSYSDFVDEDSKLTCESYPAPIRIYVSANKKGKWQRRQ